VSFIIHAQQHAMVLLAGGFYTSQRPSSFKYALCDRFEELERFRLITDITRYAGYEHMKFQPLGTTRATAQQLVEVLQADLSMPWARSLCAPRPDGSESFCLLFALKLIKGLGLIDKVTPEACRLWTKGPPIFPGTCFRYKLSPANRMLYAGARSACREASLIK